MRVLLILLLTSLVACTKAEKENDVPGGDLPPVTSSQLGLTGATSGALGDLINYISTQDQSIKTSDFSSKKDFRKTQRDQLRASIQEQFCNKQKSSNDKNFSMTGETCAVRIKTDHNTTQDGNVDGDYTLQKNSSMDFVARNNTVASEIHDMTLKANQLTEIRYVGEEYRLFREYTAQAEVMTRTMGDFVYNLTEIERREVNFSSNKKLKDVIERTDRLVFSNFEVVLYRIYEFEDGEDTTDDYYINGQSLKQDEYLSILQDLNTQLGLSGSAEKIDTGNFDPFN